MKWDEFKDLLAGIGSDTPLGRIVAIRAEDDREMLKHFTPEQRRVRGAWRSRRAASMSPQQMDDILDSLKKAFIAIVRQEE